MSSWGRSVRPAPDGLRRLWRRLRCHRGVGGRGNPDACMARPTHIAEYRYLQRGVERVNRTIICRWHARRFLA